MKFYDLDEIKQRADIAEVVRWLGLPLQGKRTQASWRNGDGWSVALLDGGYYDHVEKTGGTVIDLVMKVKSVDLTEASELLGDHLGLSKTKELSDAKVKRLEAEHIYTDDKGLPIHKTMRWRYEDGSKDLVQYRFSEGQWVLGLGDVSTYPYRLHLWRDMPCIHIHEGEQKADLVASWNIPATSFPMGAGKWHIGWAKWFADKDIVIVRDNDDAGYAHAQRIAWELRSIAKSIKIIRISDEPKGDVVDFVNAGGNADSYKAAVDNAQPIDPRTISEPSTAKADTQIERAKTLNKTPFRNYSLIEIQDGKGSKKYIPSPMIITDIMDDLKARMLGFPKLCGEELFDQDRDNKRIHKLLNAADLQSWISEKSKQPVELKTGMGYVTMDQLQSALERQNERYDLISDCPHFPPIKECYYSYGDLPKPTSDHAYFHKFCEFFCPSTYVDSLLIQLCVATLFYHQRSVDKPLWIIDTAEGHAQGSGKTKLVEAMAWLRGEEPMFLDPASIKNETLVDRILRRILSMEGRNKRIFLIDNVDSYFNSEVFASFITQSTFSGIAPYGHGETTRANDLSFFTTCNGGRFGKDIVDRSVIIHIKKPDKPLDNWVIELRRFIDLHRYQVYADIGDLLTRPFQFNKPPQTRFRVWERDVLQRVLDDASDIKIVLETLIGRRIEADGETERIELLMESFRSKIMELGEDPDNKAVWIESAAIQKICADADPDFGGRNNIHAPRVLNKYIKLGQCPQLDNTHKFWPTNHRSYVRRRGLMWNAACMPKDKHIRMLTFDGKTMYLKWPETITGGN